MSKLTDRVSFLKGLAEGMQLEDNNSNKLLKEIIAVLDDMAQEMAVMADAQEELNEYVESIDDDLADLEEVLFDEEDDCDCCDCEDGDCDCCDCCDCDEDDDLIAYACPHCGHEIEFRASDVDFDEEYLCAACGKPIFPEVEDDDDEDEVSLTDEE